MTRAREKLLLIGCAKDAAGQREAALDIRIDDAYCAKAMSYLHWLLPVAVQTDALPLILHGRKSALRPSTAAPAAEERQATQQELHVQLQALLDWRYPHQASSGIPSKRSVSELLHQRAVSLRPAPTFVQGDAPLSAAQRGTAMHTALGELDIARCPEGGALAYVHEELSRMQAQGLLSPAQAQAISAGDIARFLESEAGIRLRRAQRLERELEFSVLLPAQALGLADSAEPVLLQGVIDCCFMENGGWVILDYKTDYVQPGQSAQQAAAAHARQLELYSLALARLSGLPVHTRMVALLSLGETVEV